MAYRPAIVRQPAARLQQNSLNLAGRRQTLSNGAGRSRPPRPTAPSRLLAPYGASRTGFRRTRYPDAFSYTSAAAAPREQDVQDDMAHRKAYVLADAADGHSRWRRPSTGFSGPVLRGHGRSESVNHVQDRYLLEACVAVMFR